MANKQKMSELFSHFTTIIESEFLEDDILTKKIIEYYQDYVSTVDQSNPKEIDFSKQLDDAIYHYMEDYHFSKNFKDTLDVPVITSSKFKQQKQFLEYIVDYYREYQKMEKPKVVEKRWI